MFVPGIVIIVIIHEFHRDASLEQNFRAAMCHVLHYSCNVNAAVTDSLRCCMICGVRNSSVFSARLNAPSDGSDVIADGSAFQTFAAATGKVQSPMVLCNDRGTCSDGDDADRRRLRDSSSCLRCA